ncbi:LysR family transcriptional regulator [Nocardioides yefusunii]|uniref:LysR family transcriptional regulator n=1 Tax=Nocardioides yefusunii TaxID=2500546 RepID=A0ABW1QYB9_9ACTN|nr:LysR family transcriptional regulator [Nocardioides yefusunii]
MLGSHVPDLRSLELLLAVMRHGSLGMAAAELGITQQAASSRMRTMEGLVGETLLARSRHGSRLTETGRRLADLALPVVEAARVLDAGIRGLNRERNAHLDVAASLTIAEHMLPGWMVALRSRHLALGRSAPELTMTAANSARVVDLVRSGAVDLGFIEGPEAPADLGSRKVGVDELVVVVGPHHPWARLRSRSVTAAQLAMTPLVVREAGSGTRTVLERALDGLETVPPAIELSTTASVRSAVAAGAGPAALGAQAVSDDIAQGRLLQIEVSDVDLTRVLHAVWAGGEQPPEGPARDLVALAAAWRSTVVG